MTHADRKEAFDLIQQLRGDLMERDAITPADLTPAAQPHCSSRRRASDARPAPGHRAGCRH